MRLITRKIWRAFPELDRFGDEQCRRFVRAAASGIVARGVRWGVVAGAVLLGVALLPGLALLEEWCIGRGWWSGPVVRRALSQPRWMNEYIYLALAMSSVLLLGGLLGAVTRDFLLRVRVRRVLRTRGRCAQCTYFLGGLPVSAELQVVCPECGFVTEVDASLGELAGGADGVARFAPSEELIRASEPWLTGKRVWKWTKRAALALVALLVVGSAAFGWNEWRIRKQAARAVAIKPGADALVDMLEKAQLPGTAPGAANSFDLLGPLVTKMAQLQADVFPEGMPEDTKGAYFSIDGQWVAQRVYPNENEQAFKDREFNEPYSLKVMEEFEAKGVFDQMRAMVDAPLAVGIGRMAKEEPLVGMLLTDYSKARQFARWNAGRMRLAVRENDPYKFTDAYATTLGLSRMMERQPVLIGRLVAIAIEALAESELRAALRERHDASWLDAIESARRKYQRHEPWSLALEGERATSKDSVCWVFSEPGRARFGKYSPELRKVLGGMGVMSSVPDGRLGSLDENLDAVDRFYDALNTQAALPRWQRQRVGAHGEGLLLMKELLPSIEQSLRSGDQAEIDRVGVPLLIALERFRLEKGLYPATLDELTPRFVSALPVDPISGKAFCYRRLDASKDEQGRGFLLYIVGLDGLDNNGVSGTQPWDAIRPPGVAGIDYIINDENR